MKFHELVDMALIPKKERILNYSLQVETALKNQKVEFYLIALTELEGKVALWYLRKNLPTPNPAADRFVKQNFRTIRDHLKQASQVHFDYSFIHQISIQGKSLRPCSSKSWSEIPPPLINIMFLQHFAEQGMVFPEWGDIRFEHLDVSFQAFNLPFTEVDWDADLDLTVTIDFQPRKLLIEQSFSLPFGKLENPEKYTYWSDVNQREETYYLLGLEHYDYKQDLLKVLITRNRKIYYPYLDTPITILGETLTDDKDYALVSYSIKNDSHQQLEFYASNYLAQPYQQSSELSCLFFRSEPDPLHDGFENHHAFVGMVPKDYQGTFEFELFSVYDEIPDQTIPIPSPAAN